ncbi:NUDIX hydrolase [bacterium]|nr:NUDIX hydrolase [bacterium]
MVKSFNCRIYGILQQEKKILVSREKYGEIEILKFPGGGIELGESPENALIREFLEEANAKIEVLDFFHVSKQLQKSIFTPTQVIALYWKVRLCENEKITVHENLIPIPEKTDAFYQLFWKEISEITEDFFTFATEKEVARKIKNGF